MITLNFRINLIFVFHFSQQTDGKIKHVEVFGIQKRYTPEKHYVSMIIFSTRKEISKQIRFVHKSSETLKLKKSAKVIKKMIRIYMKIIHFLRLRIRFKKKHHFLVIW
jgi:CII-binding regulator of phage lambda lysogenization HflD